MATRLSTFFLIPILLMSAGCAPGDSGPDPEDAISRDLFMETFFRLREAALTNPAMEIRPDQRDRILQEMGVTQEDLLDFVEVWGSDPGYMQGIWDEIEERMRRAREDSDPGAPGPGNRRRMTEPGGAASEVDPPQTPPEGPGRRGPGSRGG